MVEQLSFGEWLRKQRRTLDLSRQQLAGQAGCAEITLRRIEGGTLKPSKELAASLMEKVGISKSEMDEWVRFARGLAGIPTNDAPPTVSLPQTNLPAQLTSFIGREKDQAEIIELVKKHRLVTLLGMGGVGKTRLSIRVGENLLHNFSDGVWMAELAPINDPSLVPQSVASIFGLSATPSLTVTQVLSNHLRVKNALLILDNCEHVLDASAQLADVLLKNCPALKIITTSREPLGILGEASYHLPSLSLPEADKLMDAFREFASVRLFEERAQLVQMDFSLTMENASFVAQICRRLNGIPLALELAAVHVDQFSVDEIAKQLDHAFQILTGGSRTALPRQQTIRASIDWSWNLLTDDERVLMRRLSVFAGGWTLESAQLVCGEAALTLINALVKKSLVGLNQESGSEKRFVFHEVVRQYAHEKLVEANESESLRQKHLGYFISLAERADEHFHGADQNPWLKRLSNDVSNLRAALDFAVERDLDNAVRLCAGLGWFWYRKGLLMEGRDWYEKILTGREADDANFEYFSKAFYGAGLVAHFQADYAYARKMLEKSLVLAQQNENPGGMAHAMSMLGAGYAWQGGFDMAEKYALESLALFKVTGEVWAQAFSLNVLGFACLLRGDFVRAHSAFEESVRCAREAGDRYMMSYPLSNLGSMAYQQGDLARGKELLEESLDIGLEAQDPSVISWSMAQLGHVARHQNDLKRAMELYETVLDGARTTGFKTAVVEMTRALGDAAVKTGEYQKARSLIHESITLCQSQGDVRNVVYCLNSFAVLAGAIENWSLAVKLLNVVDSQLKKMSMFMSPIDKKMFDQVVDQARHTMGGSDFDKYWAEGEKMLLADAVALVLRSN